MISLSRFTLFVIVSILSLPTCQAQEINKKVVDSNGREKLLGIVNKDAFTNDSFATWFNPQYINYEVDKKTIKPVARKLKKYEITVFMGTWCGDSKREVPRFYKILEASNFPKEQFIMVTVDNTKENYKKSPGGEEKGLNIIKVPTFIFYKEGKEVNRIVESPIESLEKDIALILDENKYTPRYSRPRIVPID